MVNAAPPASPPGAVITNPAASPSTFLPAEPVPAPAPVKPLIELTTLKLLRAKGVITEAEYESALRDVGDSAGGRAGDGATVNVAGWKTTLYGFVQTDFMWDSTQSFNEYPGNSAVARPDTYAGTHPRFEVAIRHSRFGFRFAPPAVGSIRTSGTMELDFQGGAGSGSIASTSATLSEAGFFTSPVLRIRHAYAKVETPIVDVLFGQTWNLYGFAPNYVPAIVVWAGLPGEVYGRNVQLRVSKTIKTEYVDVELAVAAMRPTQRDSAVPEGQAAARILFPKWTGWRSGSISGTALAPASIGVSGTVRQLVVGVPYPVGSASQSASSYFLTGSGLAVSAHIPVIPGSKEDKSNSLSLVAEGAIGKSVNDQYTGLTGGVANATTITSLPPVTTGSNFGTSGVIDSGLAAFDSSGKLIQPQWLTCVAGLEYYFPSGRVALFGTWGHSQLQNAAAFASPAKVRNHSNFYDGGFFVDVTQQIRAGLDYSRIVDVYQDGVTAVNDRVQASAYFFF